MGFLREWNWARPATVGSAAPLERAAGADDAQYDESAPHCLCVSEHLDQACGFSPGCAENRNPRKTTWPLFSYSARLAAMGSTCDADAPAYARASPATVMEALLSSWMATLID
jgi:hypothetical protein